MRQFHCQREVPRERSGRRHLRPRGERAPDRFRVQPRSKMRATAVATDAAFEAGPPRRPH